jgi:hypothetical protein
MDGSEIVLPKKKITLKLKPKISGVSETTLVPSVVVRQSVKPKLVIKKPTLPVAQEAPMSEVVQAAAVSQPINVLPIVEAPAEGAQASKVVPVEEAPTPTCQQLYDPCTREPIENIQVLEKRIRDLKKQMETTPIGLYGLTNSTSNYDFLVNVFINPKISLDEMVSFKLSEGGQVGSDIFEVLSRLFVYFGGIDGVNPRDGGNYKFMNKIEGGSSEIYDSSLDALRRMKCKATRAMGISDITLVNVRDDKKVIKTDDPYCEVSCDISEEKTIKTYLMSVKWYKEEKNAEHYDLEKLFTAANKITSQEQKPVDIIVFLKSKRDFEIAHNRSFRQYTRELAKTFFGWNEDVKPFLENIRRIIFESASTTGQPIVSILEKLYFIPHTKPILSLQLHQEIIVKGLCSNIKSNNDKLYLVGVLPRGGKTFIAGGIIREYLQKTEVHNLNVFWITAAPNETMTQVRDELLSKFQDFNNFEFVHVRDVTDFKKTAQHTVYFCSSQILTSTQKQGAKKREFLTSLLTGEDRLGLVFFDEAHKTGSGVKTKQEIQNIIDTYSHLNLPFIFLTATYYSILFDYQVQKNNTFIWDYTDVLMTRSLATETEQTNAIDNLKNRFGEELVTSVIERRLSNNETLATMAKAYIGFPDLYFISSDFQPEAIQRFSEQNKYRPDSGFSLSSIFAIKPDTKIENIKTIENKVRKDAYKIFDNIMNPKNIISLITPKESFIDPEVIGIPGGEPLRKEEGQVIEPSILGRINRISSEAKSRFRIDEQPTLLMFMPTGGMNTNIFYLLCAWASLLMTHKYWSDNYEVACIVDEENIGGDAIEDIIHQSIESSNNIHIINKNPKTEILTLERKLHCEKSKGLVILAGEKLSMGVSLPCTDVVFLLNEKKSPDDIIQKMYRALTPSIGKKSAFIVDLNPVRTLAAIYGYTRASHESLNTASQILDIIYDNYSWDSDIFETNIKKGADAKPISFQDHLRKLFEQAEKDQTNEYRINENIGGYEKTLSTNIKKSLNPEISGMLAEQLLPQKIKAALTTIGLKEGSRIQLEKGRLIIRSPPIPNEDDSAAEPEENTIEIVIDNFIETVSDFVKYLAITSDASTLDEALADFESNTINKEGSSLRQNVMHLIRSRTDVREGANKDILSRLIVMAVKDFSYSSSQKLFRQMKGKIEEKITRKDKILEIIHRRLTPRRKQKEEKGEVFTPIELVEQILSHLPVSVWSNPELKWLDPANGIGNFPIVAFYKLNEGLKSWEENEKKRQKHIIENMLYMIELQSNNTRIARNLFEKLCDGATPNILTADSLAITPAILKSKNFPEKYDIIIGNPPFNSGGLLKGGGTLWPKFVYKAFDLINENGYISFIHPPGWRKFYDPEDRDSQGKIWYLINQKSWNLDYIHINDSPPKHFPIVDFYVIHAKKIEKPTKYDSKFLDVINNGDVNINLPFIPNIINNEAISIINKLFKAEGTSINIIYNQTFKPSVLDKGNPGIPHYHFTSRTGEKQIYKKQYASTPDYISKEKVIMTAKAGYEKGKLFAFYSDTPMGTTNNSMYMLTTSQSQGNKLVNFFNSDVITFLMKITQYSAPPNHINEFKILNKLKMPASIDDYNLTESEKALIANVLGKKEQVVLEGKGRRITRKIKRKRI